MNFGWQKTKEFLWHQCKLFLPLVVVISGAGKEKPKQKR